MHPRSFEETVRVACSKRLSILSKNYYRTWFFSKLKHIIGKFNHSARQCRFIIGRKVRILNSLVVTIALQLSAPDTTKIDIVAAVVIAEHSHIDTVTSADRVRLRDKRTFRLVTNGYTHTENVITVFQRKIKIILSVFISYIAVPKLTSCPRDVCHTQCYTVVGYFAMHDIVGRENMIIIHIKMVTVIIFRNTGLAVVRRIDIQTAVEYMY